MMKFCRKLTALVLFSTLFTVVSTQTSNAGIETLQYCAVNFNRNIPLTETAFTYEVKYALGYDELLASYRSGNNPDFPNAAGGVVTSDHSTLLGSQDASNAGLEIYYNTTYLDGQLLFYMGRPGGYHWFKNPSWKFPEFTRAQGSSPYIHIAVVRDAQRRLALYFNGVPATQSGTTATQGDVTYNNISYQIDNNNYSDVRYFGTSGSYTAEINPKAYVSNLRLVTGAALYSATADSITVPSTAALKLNADTGTTQVILNSRTPEGLLTNESNFDQTAATLYNFGGDQTAINNQIAVGAACTPTTGDAFIGGDGVYNVYFKEGNVSKDSGALPKKRDFYFSEDATPTPITIPTPGNMVKAQNEFVGWNTQADGYGQTYRPGALYRPTDNTTLYTKWSTRKTITYNDGGGTGTLPTESNKLWEDTFTVAANSLTNGDFKFNGWRDGANVVYGPGSIYTVPDNDVSLTAVWSGDTTITTADVTIAAPIAGATPVSSTTSNGQYTTTIIWSTTPGTFGYNTVYTATVEVTPVAGYTLTGVRANLFTINGSAPTTANSLNSGIFTYQFPRTALGPALTPTFDTPTAIAGGYRVTITNYDGTYYTWNTPTVSIGSVAVTSTDGSNRVLTVTGLSPGDTATITQTTSRTNYSNGSNTVTGTTLPPLNPTFGEVTRTVGGFSVPITNYDTDYTWDTPTVSRGSVAVTGTGEWSTNSNSSGIFEWRSIASSSDGTKLAAVAYNGYIYTSTDSGVTWTARANTQTRNWSYITSSSDGTKLAATVNQGSIWTSTNSGATWTESANTGSKHWNSITSSSDGTKLAAVVCGGAIWTSTNSGLSWTESANTGSKCWYSITSSSDGTKLAAVVYGEFIYTSTDSGVTWTAREDTQNRDWYSITSSSDGTKLAAVVSGGAIWTSTNSGLTWTASANTNSKNWASIASSSDGTKLAAVAFNSSSIIYTSTDTGTTWTEQSIVGSQYLYSIASNSDGTKLAAATYNRYIYTFAPRTLTVTGLSDGDTATITQGTRRTNYPNGSNTVTGTAQVPLNPTFGSATRAASGFSVSITNYDPDFTWDTPTVTRGSVAITSTVGATRVLTVTGLLASETSTITQATSRSNYPNGTNTVTGTALNAAYNPTFDTPTATGVGFSVSITNYDADYTWDTPTVSRGSVVVTSTVGAIRVLTVTGLSPGDTATITQTTSRDTYAPGSNTVTSRTLLVISEANVAITAPVTGATPVSSLISNGQYTTAITWSDTPTTFAPNTFYTATVTVTPVAGYMLSGVGANFFTVNGNAATTANLANAGVFTYRFPETAIIVTTANISITAPATGATPVASLASNGQYTTAITWSDSPTRFAANTVYTATVTVTPITGYTLTGVAANLFRVNGDTATGTGDYSKTTLVVPGAPLGIAVDSAGNVFTVDALTGDVTKTTPQGDTSTIGTSGTVRMGAEIPIGIAVDSAGNVYVADTDSNTVTKITPGGVSTTHGTTGAAPVGIAIDSAGNVYTANISSSTVTKITPDGVSTTLGTTAESPVLIAVDSAGNVYTSHPFISSETNTVTKITPLGASSTIETSDGLAISIAVDSSGNVYTANYFTSSVTKITPGGSQTRLITAEYPYAIAVDSSGNIYTSHVPGFDFGSVTKITPQGDSSTIGATGAGPTGLAIDLAGNVYTADAFSGTVTKFSPSGGNAANAGTFTYRFAATGAKLAQSITFAQPTDMSLTSDTKTLTASSSATGSYPVTFTSLTTNTCTIESGAIRVVAAGICSVRATQAGDGIYSPANGVIRSIGITNNKLSQSITFAQPAAMNTRSSNQALTATSSAGNSYPVTLISNSTDICTISSRAIVVVKFGTCSITASQAGDGTYQSAASVTRTIQISKVAQTISFSQPSSMTVTSGNQSLSATSSATGSYPVSFASTTTGICTIDSGAIAVVAAGTCSITASQAGDDTYTAAVSVTRSIVISKVAQNITFNQPSAMTMASSDQLLGATSSAGGSYPVTYASANNAICTIVASGANRFVHVVAPGTCSITASQPGNGTYAAAASVVRTFTIAKLTQTITFTTPNAMTVTSGDQVLSATSSAAGSLTVKFTSTTPAVCRIINGNTLQAVSAGTCSITASQAGNATYSAANNVIKSFVLASARRR